MRVSLTLKNVFSTLILIIVTCTSIKISATDLSNIKTVSLEQKYLLDIINKYGVKANSIYEFYEVGSICYQHKLKKIIYFINDYNIIVFFNDSLGNCILSDIGIANLTPTEHFENHICTITETIFHYLTSPSNQSAAKQYSSTKNADDNFNNMIRVLDQCAKIIKDDQLLVFLKASTQLNQINN